MLSWFVLIILFLLLGQLIYYSLRYGITPTPTSSKVKRRVLQLLPNHLEGKIMELGSGWGTLALPLAKRYPNCPLTGYEISPLPYFFSLCAARMHRYGNLVMVREDLFNTSFEGAALVVCYLYPKAMERLKEKFERELPLEAFVLSHTFAVPGWKPLRIDYASDLYRTPIYLYQMSASQISANL